MYLNLNNDNEDRIHACVEVDEKLLANVESSLDMLEKNANIQAITLNASINWFKGASHEIEGTHTLGHDGDSIDRGEEMESLDRDSMPCSISNEQAQLEHCVIIQSVLEISRGYIGVQGRGKHHGDLVETDTISPDVFLRLPEVLEALEGIKSSESGMGL